MCRHGNRSLFVGLTVAAVCCAVIASPGRAAVKLIGDFEGDMASPYTTPDDDDPDMDPQVVSWFTDAGITVPAEFISVHDPDYVGGVTRGEQALLYTFPPEWGTQLDPYLRLHGQEQLLNDSADFPYLLFDVTTFAPEQDPESVPEGQRPYRQVFTVFNLPPPPEPSFFYDANYDTDIQQEIDIAQFGGPESFTDTVVVDMTASSPVNGDGKNVMNVTADYFRDNPPANLVWQLVWVFQGRDLPFNSQIQVVIDNVRFCSDSLAACTAAAPEGQPGDYNEDQIVNAADYTVWRNNLGGTSLTNETVSLGIVDQDDYTEWKTHFGTTGGSGSGAVSAAIPEPSSIGLLFGALAALVSVVKLRR